MLIISNNVEKIGMSFPKDSIVRINLAWLKSLSEAQAIIESILKMDLPRDIFLDYPLNRSKYPIPTLSLLDSIELANNYKQIIKYFAFSNAEEPNIVEIIRKLLDKDIILVPKIETIKGVSLLPKIIETAKTNIIMCDKEDLFTDVKGNNEEFLNIVDEIRKYGKDNDIRVLELQGVIFAERKD